MAIDNLHAEMCYLLDPAFQIEGVNGKPLVGGHIEVFLAGTDTKYITYQDWDGNENPFKIPLRADGRAVILADPTFTYDIYAYDSYGNLAFSRLNVQCNLGGDVSITGKDTVIYNTDGTLDITLQNIENNTNKYIINSHHKEFGVEEPYLYFKEDTPEATIIALSADTTDSDLVSAIGGKGIYASDFNPDSPAMNEFIKKEEFNTYSADVKIQIDAKQDILTPGVGIDITDNVISVTAGRGHTYSGQGIIKVDNVADTISADISDLATKTEITNIENEISTLSNNILQAKTEVTQGSNIRVTASTGADGHTIYTVSGKDWSSDLADKLDSTAFSEVSGSFLTAHQSLAGLMSADKLEYANSKITGYNGSAFAAGSEGKVYTGAGIIEVNNVTNTISADISNLATKSDITTLNNALTAEASARELEDDIQRDAIETLQRDIIGKQDKLTAGANIDITSNVISVTGITGHTYSGEGRINVDNTTNKITFDDSDLATTADLANKQDVLTPGDGIDITNNVISVTAQGGTEYTGAGIIDVNNDTHIISADVSNLATKDEIPDALTAGSGIDITNNVISVTATTGLNTVVHDRTMSGNGTHASPLGVSPLAQLAVDDRSMSAYTATVEGQYTLVLGVNDSVMNESKLTVEDGKITQYDGTPFAGGGGMSTVHTSEPIIGDGSEANPISANTVEVDYQQIVHDDSLVHVSNNAQYALGVNTRMFKDETLLWQGSIGTGQTATLSEPLTNFERIKIVYIFGLCQEVDCTAIATNKAFSIGTIYQYANETNQFTMYSTRFTINDTYTTITNVKSTQKYIASNNSVGGVSNPSVAISKVIGIGRKGGV